MKERIDISVPEKELERNHTKRERLKKTFAFEPTDRVPVVFAVQQAFVLAARGSSFTLYFRSPRDNLREQILNYGARLGIPRDEADALFREGRALARRRGDCRDEARILHVYGMVLYLSGAPRDSLAPLEAGLALADELEDPELRYGARAALWNAHYHLGNLVRALAYSDEGLKMAEADPHLGTEFGGESVAWAYGYRALILIAMGRLVGTSRLLRRCEEIARELDERDVLSWTEDVRSWAAHSRGDGPGALRHAGRALEHAERTGSALCLGLAWMYRRR